MLIDESHVTVPQVRGMYHGDRSRKQTLVEYGFRLPSALDNRPLRFDEYERLVSQTIFVSATPGPYEAEHAGAEHGNQQGGGDARGLDGRGDQRANRDPGTSRAAPVTHAPSSTESGTRGTENDL